MTKRIDHAANAVTCLYEVGDLTGLEEFARADLMVKVAQAEATLALVEQQRVANLIELSRMSSGVCVDAYAALTEWKPNADGEQKVYLRPEIAAALGIEVETGD